LYKAYRAKVDNLRRGFKEETKRGKIGTENHVKIKPFLVKKSRWSDAPAVTIPPATNHLKGKSAELIGYAIKVYGNVDLDEDQWKQCEDQMKVSTYNMVE